MNLVFLCTHNACRSIIAEAIARQFLSPTITVESAGSAPKGRVNPDALHYLTQRHYSVEGLASKSWELIAAPDVVITLCDEAVGEFCPVWFGDALRIHWGMADPSRVEDPGARRAAFNQLIQTLEDRIRGIAAANLTEMTTPARLALFTDLGA